MGATAVQALTPADVRLTPHGHLVIEGCPDAIPLAQKIAQRLIRASDQGSGAILLELGGMVSGFSLPPNLVWWSRFAARYLTELCRQPSDNVTTIPSVPPLEEGELASLVLSVPLMTGAEYLTPAVLRSLWDQLAAACADAVQRSGTDLQTFLQQLNPVWNVVGRVYFNLAEQRQDPDTPFAFLATYTTHLSAQAKAQHIPLGQAFKEYAGARQKNALLALLTPVNRAAATCPWLQSCFDAGDLFHPLRWTVQEAAQFLASADQLERAGIIVRLPATWKARRPPRPKVTATVGKKAPSQFGLESLLDFSVSMTLDGIKLTAKEIQSLLEGTENLVLLRGQWVELDRERLAKTWADFQTTQRLAMQQGISFAEAMRLLSGASIGGDSSQQTHAGQWSEIMAGSWLENLLQNLRNPHAPVATSYPGLQATLRSYQTAGVEWLQLLTGLGLGACLADDMGLGKTIQVLALLLQQKHQAKIHKTELAPALLVAPASLLTNWTAEIIRFAPSLNARIVHSSALSAAELQSLQAADLAPCDLVITTYASLQRLPILAGFAWRMVILDEAQAIKNKDAKQTKAVKALQTQTRIALTGTPVENHLGDLWSIFDFLNPGLLGTAKEFSSYAKNMTERTENVYAPLRNLVRPYILRRMKTDTSIIADLPDKIELKSYCALSRQQAALYEQAVQDLKGLLETSEGIQRRGIVLAMLTRLKQICNHPSQWLHDGNWGEPESGKFRRLREIAEVIKTRQEKMLLFTQFRETIEPLAAFLESIFGRPGVVLHGATGLKQRRERVERFQEDEQVPFFILSLKAGGSGLTLTAASHVVHFDRWWNPAVENQATDRAFRIGQKRNVVVHAFVCQGTIEEKIDAMIAEKRAITQALLAEGNEINVTELSNEQLLDLVRLDLNSSMKE